jgi:proliferating cell nuclear antigen
MRITLESKEKQEIFVGICQLLKNWGSILTLNFELERVYIQAMDKSHVCLAEICLQKDWFNTYECFTNKTVCVDIIQFATLIHFGLKQEIIELTINDSIERLCVNYINSKDKKNVFDHYYELILIDEKEDELTIPNVDYDVEFIMESKNWSDILGELATFGPDLNIICTEDKMEFIANSDSTNVKINILVKDIDEYSIIEDSIINVSYSMNHIYKMCCSTKLSNTIEIGVSKEFPLCIKYNLGNNSEIKLYIAPKIIDE